MEFEKDIGSEVLEKMHRIGLNVDRMKKRIAELEEENARLLKKIKELEK
jgi:hypothetical protein